jgi:hypothetical protein
MEGVIVQGLPTSRVGQACDKRRNQSSEMLKGRSGSCALARGQGLKMDNQQEKENTIRVLNRHLMDLSQKIEEMHKRVFKKIPKTTQMDDLEDAIGLYKQIWSGFLKVILLLRLYRPLVGMSVVFAQASPAYMKLTTLVTLGNNLIDSITLKSRKGYSAVKILELSTTVYLDFLKEI